MITADLEAAYHRLYELVWNLAEVEVGMPGYSGVDNGDLIQLDQQCVKIQALLAGKPGKNDAARGAA